MVFTVVGKLKFPIHCVSPVVYDALGGVLVVLKSYRGCKFSVPVRVRPSVCRAQFLRYLDKNVMEGVFQYYL